MQQTQTSSQLRFYPSKAILAQCGKSVKIPKVSRLQPMSPARPFNWQVYNFEVKNSVWCSNGFTSGLGTRFFTHIIELFGASGCLPSYEHCPAKLPDWINLFWRYCKNMSIPDNLQNKIELYRANGRIYRQDIELFNETSWLAVMHGQGIVPKGYHPLVDVLSEETIIERLEHIKSVIDNSAEIMPTQKAFIAEHCQSAPVYL